ncbi:MAG TPA: hypothetical protein PLN48_00755 [Lachnospiraceae bacterium]|nr:hypothetical protein [Lachnospiraceae bacterium]
MEKYVKHYFDFKNAGLFMLLAFIGLIVILALILVISRFQSDYRKKYNVQEYIVSEMKARKKKPYILIESFYELVFSSTSVLFFLALYYIIDARMPNVSDLWESYKDIILLLFICLSVLMTNYMDRFLVRLGNIDNSRKASIRLVSCIYIILILMYIRFIYEDTNYNELIIYFVSLAIGRFIFFDFTVEDFTKTLEGVVGNLPLLLLMVIYSGLMCWVGFRTKFLLTSNGVIISILIAHCFMDISIFVLEKTRLLRLFL